jgi:hypothetical protein
LRIDERGDALSTQSNRGRRTRTHECNKAGERKNVFESHCSSQRRCAGLIVSGLNETQEFFGSSWFGYVLVRATIRNSANVSGIAEERRALRFTPRVHFLAIQRWRIKLSKVNL